MMLMMVLIILLIVKRFLSHCLQDGRSCPFSKRGSPVAVSFEQTTSTSGKAKEFPGTPPGNCNITKLAGIPPYWCGGAGICSLTST